MPHQTTTELFDALRVSGLFPGDQLRAVLRDLEPLAGDTTACLHHLINTARLTVYQLRKVLNGKAAELIVGEYVITDRLGEGGMGKVYRARQVRVGREVALKIIRPKLLDNPVVRGRYEREVRAASALRHPNIVAVENAGESDGRTWLAMEFVDGVDLARLVKEHGILPVPEACEYLRQTALGLQHAHDVGFIHRDVKPSNIVVSGERHIPQAQGPARVKLLDMGLVRGGLEEDEGGLELTRAGTVVGTPDYMAPEQGRNSSTVDHRADLYAVGSTFYFLLTGRPPFPDGTAIEKLLKHQVDPPPPLQAGRPDVPAELARVVARLLAKKPQERFESAGELAAALAPFTRYPADLTFVTDPAEAVPISPAAETTPPSSPGKTLADHPAHVEPVPEPAKPFEFPTDPSTEQLPMTDLQSTLVELREEPVVPPRPSRKWAALGTVICVALLFALTGWLVVHRWDRGSGATPPEEVPATDPAQQPPAPVEPAPKPRAPRKQRPGLVG
jgi:serine/threonine-protein kinase